MLKCPKCNSSNISFRDFSLKANGIKKLYGCKDCYNSFVVTPQQVRDSLIEDRRVGINKKEVKPKKAKPLRHCITCGSTNYHAKGLCNRCYKLEWKKKRRGSGNV